MKRNLKSKQRLILKRGFTLCSFVHINGTRHYVDNRDGEKKKLLRMDTYIARFHTSLIYNIDDK